VFAGNTQGEIMKAIVWALATLSIVAALAAPASAESRTKKKHAAKQHYGAQVYPSARSRNVPEYQEFIAEKRPFGSSSWWEQMDREGRGGQGRPN
jgi:hypothetical protein